MKSNRIHREFHIYFEKRKKYFTGFAMIQTVYRKQDCKFAENQKTYFSNLLLTYSTSMSANIAISAHFGFNWKILTIKHFENTLQCISIVAQSWLKTCVIKSQSFYCSKTSSPHCQTNPIWTPCFWEATDLITKPNLLSVHQRCGKLHRLLWKCETSVSHSDPAV